MAEIARAGILSVDTGQMEAAQALGMSRGQGDAAGRAATGDAGDRAADRQRDHRHAEGHLAAAGDSGHDRAVLPTAGIGARTFQVFPILVAATLYYLIASSVLMVGQAYLEKRFGRGFGTR